MIHNVIGVDLLSQSLLPAIVDLAEDSKWRVRHAIIEHIPKLAEQLGCDYFNEKLSNLCMAWLGDEVYSIRRSAAANLYKLSAHFGEDWTMEYIFPRIEKMQTHANYLQRMTALYGIQVLVKSLSKSCVEKQVLPLVSKLADDKVPNVRLNVARTLLEAMTNSGHNYSSKLLSASVLPLLTRLSSDDDRDVRFYAVKV